MSDGETTIVILVAVLLFGLPCCVGYTAQTEGRAQEVCRAACGVEDYDDVRVSGDGCFCRYAPQPEEEAWPRDVFGRGPTR